MSARSVRGRRGLGFAAAICVVAAGCASQNPEWAGSINPCCGQDEVLTGGEPSEKRCADMVVSREAALPLAWRVASGSGMNEWRVRLIPGGPACIWRKWPGLTAEDLAQARTIAGADSVDAEPAHGDSVR